MKLLEKLDACSGAKEWAKNKTFEEIFKTCERGDWLLWLFARVSNDKRKLTLAKAHCANTARHLMKDKRSTDSIDVAIRYGEGNATEEYLYNAANAAAYAAYAAAYAAYAAAKKENQKLTADICRKFLPIEIWNINKNEILF